MKKKLTLIIALILFIGAGCKKQNSEVGNQETKLSIKNKVANGPPTSTDDLFTQRSFDVIQNGVANDYTAKLSFLFTGGSTTAVVTIGSATFSVTAQNGLNSISYPLSNLSSGELTASLKITGSVTSVTIGTVYLYIPVYQNDPAVQGLPEYVPYSISTVIPYPSNPNSGYTKITFSWNRGFNSATKMYTFAAKIGSLTISESAYPQQGEVSLVFPQIFYGPTQVKIGVCENQYTSYDLYNYFERPNSNWDTFILTNNSYTQYGNTKVLRYMLGGLY